MLKDKVAVIYGAGGAIGGAVALAYAPAGAKLFLAGRHLAPVESVAKDIVYSHHERWDGSGYPEGLGGRAIPIAGRIIAIVDLYDALLSSRPYHQARTHAAAIAFIAARRGTHFDPDVVDACLREADKLEAVPRDEPQRLAVG